MGYASAVGMADSVSEGMISLKVALQWHLTTNFYPPLPVGYVPPLVEAIEAVNDYDYLKEIVLGDLNPLPKKAWVNEDGEAVIYAGALVDILRADSFLDDTEE